MRRDLTPELLAQLEQDADGWCRNRYVPGASAADDDEGADLSGEEVDPFHVYIRTEEGLRLAIRPECDDMDEFLARALNALPALVAAAKERDYLRAEVATHGEQIAAIMDGTFSVGDGSAQKEIERLREAVRLRDLATLEAWSGSLTGLEESERLRVQAEALESMAGNVAVTVEEQRDAAFAKLAAILAEKLRLRDHVRALLGCIDRKSYSSAAQQEAVRAAEAAIGGAQ